MATQDLVLIEPPDEPTHTSEFLPAMTMEMALQRRNIMVEFTKSIMTPDQDFGVIPGTHKPTLLKPGAEKLCSFFGLEPEFIPAQTDLDWTGERHGGEPFIYYHYRCRLLKNGRCFGAGEGSCNSWESKYRYRWVLEDTLPDGFELTGLPVRGGRLFEFAFAVDKAETTGKYGKPAEYWQRFHDAIEDGTARRTEKETRTGKTMDGWEIEGTEIRIPNPDVADVANTIMKMAQKRSLVAATLIATSASEFYTQDLEDYVDTGGHHVGTQAAADHVAKRKIAEAHAIAPEPVGDGLVALYQSMTDFAETVAVFDTLRSNIEELTGADVEYCNILANHGMRSGQDIKGKTRGQLKSAVKDLWEYAEKCRVSAEPPDNEQPEEN